MAVMSYFMVDPEYWEANKDGEGVGYFEKHQHTGWYFRTYSAIYDLETLASIHRKLKELREDSSNS
jgi:predicted glutamine amidotransferase